MRMPIWLTWANVWPVLSGVPGWIALILALKKSRRERTILEFTVKATHVEAEPDEATMAFDGTPMVRALWVTITNIGQRPITILQVKCTWSGLTKAGKSFQSESRDWVNKKLAEGDHCFGSPHLHQKPTGILSAQAVDSTGKEWQVPGKIIEVLNASGFKEWH